MQRSDEKRLPPLALDAHDRAAAVGGRQQALLFAVLLLVDSMHFIFARLLLPHMAPTTSAMYVLGIGAVEVGIFALVRRKLRLAPVAKHFWFFLAIGALIALSTMLTYESVAFVEPGTASLLSKTGVIFTLLLSVLWLGERFGRRQLAGSLVTITGAVMMSYVPGDYLHFGALLILISTLFYALHAAIVKRHGGDIDFLNFFFYRLAFTSAILFALSLARGALTVPDAATALLLLVTGTVDVVISRAIYYATMRTLPLSVHTIILMLSPVVSIFVALLLFQSFPTLQELAGGLLVLAGVFIVTRNR